jgi:hypothetical protein
VIGCELDILLGAFSQEKMGQAKIITQFKLLLT